MGALRQANHTPPEGGKIHLQDDAAPAHDPQTLGMHQDNEVRVFTDGHDGSGKSPAGVGWLVTPNVVLMRQPGRGATPGLPSHIKVPAASGGGRGGEIKVLDVIESPDLPEWLALQLDEDVDVAVTGEPPEGLDLSGLSGDGASSTSSERMTSSADSMTTTADDGVVSPDGWLCRAFPRLPGCGY